VRTALERAPSPHRRAADRTARPNASDEASGAAQHLLQRRSVLDEALRHQDESAIANIMRRTPPIPTALLMIEMEPTRERYSKVLTGAKVEVEVARNHDDALALLASRIHALLFTDSLEFVRRARQLASGAATHIVFVNSGGDKAYGEALRAGASDCMPSEARGEKFWAHMTMVRRIVDLAASLQLALTDNRLLATIDELTRTGSRRFFERQFPREVERAARLGLPLALVMCDIDHFKRINDSFGHQIGDEVLRELADRLSKALRVEDWIARIGGEEFAVVLPETADLEARAIAKRLCGRINSPSFAISSEPLPVTASFGLCAMDRVPRECRGISTAMIKAADAALYQSKHRGRNRVTAASFHPQTQAAATFHK
jgi:two-component system cell cycle response regulator